MLRFLDCTPSLPRMNKSISDGIDNKGFNTDPIWDDVQQIVWTGVKSLVVDAVQELAENA